jgi:shikimate kinase
MDMLLTLPLGSAPRADSPHVVLVGLPGVGKSSAARRVARRLGRPFLDFDTEIEAREGMPVERIFAEKGEAHFRAGELALTREVAELGGLVLAPGGGWMTSDAAVALIRPHAIIFYLRLRPEMALARVRRAKRARPLLTTADPLATMRRLLAEREVAYLSADHVVDVAKLSPAALVSEIVRLAGA